MRIELLALASTKDQSLLEHTSMGFMLLKKVGLLLLLIAGTLLSTSLAGRQFKALDASQKEIEGKEWSEMEAATIHERLLKANTKDYGKYDPSPALVKPPFKLIPN